MKCKECGAHLPYGAYGHIRCEFCNAPNYVPVPGEKPEATGKIDAKREHVKRDVETGAEKEGSSKSVLKKVILVGIIFMAIFVVLGVIGLLVENGNGTPDPTYTPKPTTTTPPITTKPSITTKPPKTTSPPVTIKPAKNFLTYDNPTYGLRIKYPDHWLKDEQVMGTIVAFSSPKESASDEFLENLNIVYEDLSVYPPMTLKDYTDLSVDNLRLFFTDFNLISTTDTTLAKEPAKSIFYTYTQGQYTLKIRQIYTIKNDQAYIITYGAPPEKYDAYLAIMQEMSDSFELLTQTKPTTTPPPSTPPPLGAARSNPASIGNTVQIEFEDWSEKYEVKITLQEVIRGAEAWRRIEVANMFNDPPTDGFEYVLTKIKFEYLKGPTPDTVYDVSGYAFDVISSEGKEYDNPVIVDPEPALDGNLYPGASIEGWSTYEVATGDSKPLLTFGRDYLGKGGGWFKLYGPLLQQTTTQTPSTADVWAAWESTAYSYTGSEVTYEITIEVHNDGKADTKDLEIWAGLATAEAEKVWDQEWVSVPAIGEGNHRTRTVYLTAPLDKNIRIEIGLLGSNFETVYDESAWFDT